MSITGLDGLGPRPALRKAGFARHGDEIDDGQLRRTVVTMALGLELAKPFASEGALSALRAWSPVRDITCP